MLLDHNANRSVIDCMRAIGILLVICFHVVVGLTKLLEGTPLTEYIAGMPEAMNIMWQALGSEIIFLFSGFLLSYLLLREHARTGHIDVRDFYVRRLSRIVPMYLLAILLYSFVDDFTPLDVLLNLLFVSKIFRASTIVPVGWSLEVLVQSYVLLPIFVLAMLRSRHPILLTLAAIAAAIVLRYAEFAADPASYTMPIHSLFTGAHTTPVQNDAYYLLVYRATPFLLGFLLAYLVVHRDAALGALFARAHRTAFIFAASIAIIVASGFLPIHDPDSVLYRVAGDRFWLWFWTLQRFVFSIGIAGFSLSLWYGSPAWAGHVRSLAGWRVWKKVSANIYSVYLFHPVFLIPGAAIGFRTISQNEIAPVHIAEVWATIVVVATLSTAFGSLLTRFYELPAQGWIRNRLRRAES